MTSHYIPSGRTSVVKRGEATFQLQTEYARMPHPRVTTTIFTSGQVLHKIERPLEGEIDSIERMHEVEEIIKIQHLEVSKTLKERGLPTEPGSRVGEVEKKTRSERIRGLNGVERVYMITPEGKMVGDKNTTKDFKKMFKHLFKALPDLISVFAELPGEGREQGIYEVEPGKILLASTGVEFYLILINSGQSYSVLAPQIKSILQA
ncbi:MAG: hypothetical protein R3F48_14050 [Candidatus Zixiibacteriota bacterium]